MKLIDVSYHNGTINFAKVKADGIGGVIIRAGYGTTHEDAKFKTYIKDALAAGLAVGVYWFSYAYSVGMARKEAEKCISLIKPYKISLPVFFDFEYDSVRYAKTKGVIVGRSLLTSMTNTFCAAIEKAGYQAGFYFNEDYRRNMFDMSALSKYKTWYARYTNNRPSGYDYWQYSSKGRINGISGNVDLDEMLTAAQTTTPDTKPAPAQTVKKKTVAEIAQEVISGKWGTGADRKKRLTEAGYNYSSVQKKVNELLKASGTKTHVVKKGETLSGIAKKYGTTVAKIAAVNGISNVNKIYAGQKLIIK